MKVADFCKATGGSVKKFNENHGEDGKFSSGQGFSAAHKELKQNGFTSHKETLSPQTGGPLAQTVREYKHPSGHTATVSMGPGPGENFWRIKHVDGSSEEGSLSSQSIEHLHHSLPAFSEKD